MIYWPTKSPTEVIDYGMNWAPTLSLLTGSPTIVSQTWTIVSGNVTLGAQSIDADGKGTNVRVSAGTDGTEAIVKNTVTLSDGQIIDENAFVKIRA